MASRKVEEVKSLMRDYFENKITRQECHAAIRELFTPEPELPLGIGAKMPEAEKR